MYIKIIGSIVLIFSAAAVGYLKAEELEVRVRTLKEMKRMITFLQGELRFHRSELSEAFESVSERVEPIFSVFLSQTAKELEKREVIALKIYGKSSVQFYCRQKVSEKKIINCLRCWKGVLDIWI